jgi:NAD+ dependent glucose-6-phosphate dehydrogenase
MSAAKKKVLITGGAGLIGSILLERLKAHYELASFDLREAPGVQSYTGNLTDFATVLHAFQSQDTIVHLAADPRADSPWASNLSNNLIGTYHVFEAALQAGVTRVVFASSQHTTGGFYLDEPYKAITEGRYQAIPPHYPLVDETCPIRPDGYYGTAKAFGEALGSYYWDYHTLSSLHLRIGWVIATDDPTFSAFALTLWLSHRDVTQVVQRCIEAPASLGYDIFYATSDNKWKIWSIEKAKQRLDYRPEDSAGDNLRPGPMPRRDL